MSKVKQQKKSKKPKAARVNKVSSRSTATLEKWILLAASVTALWGVACRIVTCFNAFWLDEIWSYIIVKDLRSPAEVFTKFNDSNNHHLVSLWFFVVGDTKNWVIYRLPSLVAGVLTILLVWVIMRRSSRLAARLSVTLTIGSYLMVHYSSEARGYALVLFFALLTYYGSLRFSETGRIRWAGLIWASSILGFLSHMMYLFAFVGVACWLSLIFLKAERKKLSALISLTKAFAVPVLFLSWFSFYCLRYVRIGGGEPYKVLDLLVQTLSYAAGGPASGPLATIAAVVCVSLFVAAIAGLFRNGKTEWLLFAVIIFLAPALTLLIERPEVLFVRYFLLSVLFGYLAVALFVADLHPRSSPGLKLGIVLVLGIFLLGNGANIIRLLRYGRGGYLEAMRFMEANTAGNQISISSDNQLRNGLVVEFYKRYLTSGKEVVMVPDVSPESPPPQWHVEHCIGALGEVYEKVQDPQGNPFILRRVYPYSDLSGWYWLIYERDVPRLARNPRD